MTTLYYKATIIFINLIINNKLLILIITFDTLISIGFAYLFNRYNRLEESHDRLLILMKKESETITGLLLFNEACIEDQRLKQIQIDLLSDRLRKV